LSVHSGSWEWGACLLGALGARVHLAASPQREPAIEHWFAGQRARHGLTRLADRPLWSSAARALRRREWVAIMGDRLAPGGRDSVCAWAAAVARRTGAVILPALILRRPGGGYVAHFEPPITPHDCLAGGFRRAVWRHLERSPGQWLAFEPLPEGLA
jgi:lauroyl/myristoyl acyltransferase